MPKSFDIGSQRKYLAVLTQAATVTPDGRAGETFYLALAADTATAIAVPTAATVPEGSIIRFLIRPTAAFTPANLTWGAGYKFQAGQDPVADGTFTGTASRDLVIAFLSVFSGAYRYVEIARRVEVR